MSDELRGLARQFREQIAELRHSIAMFENGTMRLYNGKVDVSQEHIAALKHAIHNLNDGIAICEAHDGTVKANWPVGPGTANRAG